MLEIKSCVVQEDTAGCNVACLATILQIEYQTTSNLFSKDFNKEGLKTKEVADYLAGWGFDITHVVPKYYCNYTKHIERMLKPFADIHIVNIHRYADLDYGHAVIMLNDGTLLNPATGTILEGDFISILEVLGIWYPPNWDFATLENKQNALDNSSNSPSSSTS